MTSNQQIPSSTPLKYAVESSSSYGSSSSNNLPLPSPSPKLSPGKSRHHVGCIAVPEDCDSRRSLLRFFSSPPSLYLSHGFPYISTHFRVCCSTTERNIYLIELCLSVSSLKWLWWFCSMAANSLKKTSPPPVLWLFPPRLLTPFFSVNLCYPPMLNHCHLLYIYDNISSRVIET